MVVVYYIAGFYLLMTAIGWIMGMLRINRGILGTIFNICLMLFRKIWPIFVVLFIVMIVSSAFTGF